MDKCPHSKCVALRALGKVLGPRALNLEFLKIRCFRFIRVFLEEICFYFFFAKIWNSKIRNFQKSKKKTRRRGSVQIQLHVCNLNKLKILYSHFKDVLGITEPQ